MKAFAALIDRLIYTRSRNSKLALIADYLRTFREQCGADELMINNPAPDLSARHTVLDILAAID